MTTGSSVGKIAASSASIAVAVAHLLQHEARSGVLRMTVATAAVAAEVVVVLVATVGIWPDWLENALCWYRYSLRYYWNKTQIVERSGRSWSCRADGYWLKEAAATGSAASVYVVPVH